MKRNAGDVRAIMKQLSEDQHVVGACPSCGHKAPLQDWNLFYMDAFPSAALEFVEQLKEEVKELRATLLVERKKATSLAEKKSVEVNLGKVLEKVAPVLDTFPYDRGDCRGLFDPIDYIVFKGLSEKGSVDQVLFAEIKTGNARLNPHQETIRRAVEKGRVDFGLY